MKFQIEWINIGRHDFSNKIIKEFKDLEEAEKFAYDCAYDHLMSMNVNMSNSKTVKEHYTLWAGIRPVGTIKITEVKNKKQEIIELADVLEKRGKKLL